jgi:hypothetical protein
VTFFNEGVNPSGIFLHMLYGALISHGRGQGLTFFWEKTKVSTGDYVLDGEFCQLDNTIHKWTCMTREVRSWMEGDGYDAFTTVATGKLIWEEDIALLSMRNGQYRWSDVCFTNLLWPNNLIEPSFFRSSVISLPGVRVDHRIPSAAPK